MSALTMALLITLAGMGLVFGTILLFWGVMALMVRLIGGQEGEEASAGPIEAEGAGDAAGRERKRRAALVAVAVALSLEGEEQPRPFPLPAPVLVNTWQSVLRARQLSQRRSVR